MHGNGGERKEKREVVQQEMQISHSSVEYPDPYIQTTGRHSACLNQLVHAEVDSDDEVFKHQEQAAMDGGEAIAACERNAHHQTKIFAGMV